MDRRLRKLEAEWARTEAAVVALSGALNAPAQVPAPRFPAYGISAGGGPCSDLKPERADPLVGHSKPRYSIPARGRSSGRGNGGAALGNQGGVATELHRAAPQAPWAGKSLASGAAVGAVASRAPRWAAPSGRRLRVYLVRGSTRESVGLVLDKRSATGCLRVLRVKPDTAAASWNEVQAASGRQDTLVSLGDVVLEANGRKLSKPTDLHDAIDGSLEVNLVLLRDAPGRRTCSTGRISEAVVQRKGGERHSSPRKAAPARPARPPSKPATPSRAPHRHAGGGRAEAEAEAQPSDTDSDALDSQPSFSGGLLPGRCCRALSAPCWRSVPRLTKPPEEEPPATKGAARPTFGSGARFAPPCKAEGPPLCCPDDRLLSTKSAPRCALIPPPATKTAASARVPRRSPKLAQSAGNSAAYAVSPGLRGVHGAWVALMRELMVRNAARHHREAGSGHASDGEDISTDAGSEVGELEESSYWSSNVSEMSEYHRVPGPGSYSPNFFAVKPNSARGTPSFGRYSARPRAKAEAQDDESERGGVSSTASTAASSTDTVVAVERPRITKGGCINPEAKHQARSLTARRADDQAAAERPFYDAKRTFVDPAAPTVTFAPVAKQEKEDTSPGSQLGPGAYALPPAFPAGPAAFIAPEPKEDPLVMVHREEAQVCPGPAEYDVELATDATHPRVLSARFGPSVGHPMEYQRAPAYIAEYESLEPKWDVVQARRQSAVILPEHKPAPSEILRAEEHAQVGPGTYDADDWLVQRVRPDRVTHRWVLPSDGRAEHIRGLFAAGNDERPLLDPEADMLLRRRRRCTIFRPLSAPPNLDRGGQGEWRFYEPQPPPSPRGLVDFAGRIRYEDFPDHRSAQLLRRAAAMDRWYPNLQLTYSLPDLEVLRQRAPQPDFGRAQGRPASDPGDDAEPREGDVLILSLNGDRNLLHPRAPSLVDMARQPARAPVEPADPDDCDVLLLSPRPEASSAWRQSPCLVNMSQAGGRAEVPAGVAGDAGAFSAHVWAEDADGRAYTYIPTSGLQLRADGADECDLDPGVGDEYLKVRKPSHDFGLGVGRPGIDHRAPDPTSGLGENDEHALLVHYSPPQPRRKIRMAAVPGEPAEGSGSADHGADAESEQSGGLAAEGAREGAVPHEGASEGAAPDEVASDGAALAGGASDGAALVEFAGDGAAVDEDASEGAGDEVALGGGAGE